MKLQLAALAALVTIPAFSHTGHTEIVDGHTHTFSDLAAMGVGPALLAVAGVVIVVFWVKRHND